jgi:hypothetical protein
MNCKICNKSSDTRLGVCFTCAEAESIIATGVDMFDSGPKNSPEEAKTAMEKLKFLVEKGWVYKN